MNYSYIDEIIKNWADDNSIHVSTEFGGIERRFGYISGGADESFQVSIEPPEGSRVTVNAWSVETRDDGEFHRRWDVPVSGLRFALDEAVIQIAEWSSRRHPAR